MISIPARKRLLLKIGEKVNGSIKLDVHENGEPDTFARAPVVVLSWFITIEESPKRVSRLTARKTLPFTNGEYVIEIILKKSMLKIINGEPGTCAKEPRLQDACEDPCCTRMSSILSIVFIHFMTFLFFRR